MQSSGNIVIAGLSRNSTSTEFKYLAARFLPNGTLDLSFNEPTVTNPSGTPGYNEFHIGTGAEYPNAIAIQDDEKIVMVGGASNGSNNDIGIARLTADGLLDDSFDGDGTKQIAFSGGEFTGFESANTVSIQPDHKILIGGIVYRSATQYDALIIRLNTNGSFDDGSTNDSNPVDLFGETGYVVFSLSSEFDAVNGLAVQSDGKIVAAISRGFASAHNDQSLTLARFNSNGRLDDGSIYDTNPSDRFGLAGMVNARSTLMMRTVPFMS